MKRHIIILYVGLLAAVSGHLLAQESIRDWETGEFPTVSFVLQTPNPEPLNVKDITVMEEGVTASDIKLERMTDTTKVHGASILLLWDFRGPKEFAPSLLANLLEKIPDSLALRFNASMFRRDENGKRQYKPLSDKFTTIRADILNSILEQSRNLDPNIVKSCYEINASDILWALPQAIKQLEGQDGAKAIILFSDGKNNYNTESETEPIIKAAKDMRVSIYVVNIAGDEAGMAMSEKLSSKTYGLLLRSNGSFNTRDERKANKESGFLFAENDTIDLWLRNIPERCKGAKYTVSFKSHYERVGCQMPVDVTVAGEKFREHYDVPGFSLWLWVKENVWLFIAILTAALAAVGVGLFFLIRYLRDIADERREEEDEKELERKRLKDEQEALRRKLEVSENERRRQQEQESRREKESKRQERLSALNAMMSSRNMKVQLLVSPMSKPVKQYVITKAETSIGSATDNDIIIEDSTVSRHHAILAFNGRDFIIRDQGSTNGIVMNGYRLNEITLRNGDAVSLGNTVIKFNF